MKNLKWKFKVTGNNNTYFATSLKAIASFCRKNDVLLIEFRPYRPLANEKKVAEKCGWGVWGIIDNN